MSKVKLKLDDNGNSLLHWAAAGGNSFVLEKVLREGFDVNRRNNLGITPLMISASRGDLNCVCNLLKYGANKGIKCQNGFDALTYSILKNRHNVTSYFLSVNN